MGDRRNAPVAACWVAGAWHRQERRSCSRRLLPSTPLAYRQALLTVEPLGLLAVYDMALPPQQNKQPPVAEPTPLGCQRPQALAQIMILGASTTIAAHARRSLTPCAARR